MNKTLFSTVRRVGCTMRRHRELGSHAGINARAGETWRNWSDWDPDNAQMLGRMRDAQRLNDILTKRIRHYQFESRWFNRRFSHLLSNYND